MDRAPFEYTLDTDDRFDRVLYTPGTYENPSRPGKATPTRLRVLWDDGIISIGDEPVTSEARTSQPIKDAGLYLYVTDDELRWLHRTIGELVGMLDEAEKVDAAKAGEERKP